MKRQTIEDPSSRTGVFEGDLAYGRRDGVRLDRADHSGDANMPVVPLILVQPRDKSVWRHDPLVKLARKYSTETQTMKNDLLQMYRDNLRHMKANFHLTISNQRF